ERFVRIDAAGRGSLRVRLDHDIGEGGTEIADAYRCLTNRLRQVRPCGILEDISECPIAHRLQHVRLAGVHRQYDDPRGRGGGLELSQDLEAVQSRELQVQERHV